MNGIPVLSCPSSGPFLGYRFNMGSGVSHRRQRNGLMTLEKGILAAKVTDGLSNTAALSERLSGESEPNGGRLPKNVGIVVMPMVMSEADFVTGCNQQTDPYNFSFNPGLDWRVGETWDTQYNHFLTPNPKHWDCVGIRHAILSARSRHTGGVNLLLADGAVKWIASEIDRSTWHALGTIANNDTPGNLE
jgi:prepilin-type processing-associated H-X9-DG protein